MNQPLEANGPDKPTLGSRLLGAEFPHPVENEELIETHISWVVLTGRFAYKFKKPVDLGFVDYSTIELRHQNCLRELEINGVWAADIYLDVVPVFESGERLRIGRHDESAGDGERLIDHAVRMRQFDQESLLSRRLKAGQVTPQMTEMLAGDLAELHHRATAVPYDSELVSRGAIEPAQDNFVYLLKSFQGAGDDRASDDVNRLAVLRDWSEEQIEKIRPLLEKRASTGRVRQCHGDLHLDNLLHIDGRFVPFDAIEFNDRLREVEGLSETAFLAMELSEHGFVSHARRLLNRYVEAANDYQGLTVLRFFLVYRAMVRAKVDRIRQLQGDASESDPASRPEALSPTARDYVAYAERLVAPQSAELWLTYGPSGSGKSTRAGQVVESRGFFRIRADVQRKLLAGIDPFRKSTDEEAAELYSAEMTRRTYAHLLRLAEQILAAGFGVIVDATFLHRDQRRPFFDLARRQGVTPRVLVCDGEESELRSRIAARGVDPSDASAELISDQLASAEPLSGDELSAVVAGSDSGG